MMMMMMMMMKPLPPHIVDLDPACLQGIRPCYRYLLLQH